MSVFDKELIEAYKLTDFHVKSKPPFTINIGYQSQELMYLYKKYKVSSGAFITAWNPYSEALTEKENEDRNLKLFVEISSKGYLAINGFGKDPLGKWAGEESFFILGINLDTVKSLANQYQQNAVIWCDYDAIPQLILFR
jgi:hypothetical protein